MTPVVRTSTLIPDLTFSLICLSKSGNYNTEDYTITSVNSKNIIITSSDGKKKNIPSDMVLELSRKANVTNETAFELIATLAAKRDPGDMAIELILSLLENRSAEEVEDMLREYGDSANDYLISTICPDTDCYEDSTQLSDDNYNFEQPEPELCFISERSTADTIRSDLQICRDDLMALQKLLGDGNGKPKELETAIKDIKKRIKELKQLLKEVF